MHLSSFMSQQTKAQVTHQLSYFVIPFFLVVKFPSPPYDDRSSLEYTFEMRLTTTTYLYTHEPDVTSSSSYPFAVVSAAKSESDTHILTVELKCRTYELGALFCYKGKHKQYPSDKRNLVNISDYYQDTIFQVRFNKTGTTDYATEKTSYKTMEFMLNLYRSFGSQLNIGAEMDLREELMFRSTEMSVVGFCPTDFEVKHQPAIGDRRHVLDKDVSLLLDNYPLEKDKVIRIIKQRRMRDCSVTSDYMFGSTFWSELFPVDTEEELITSQSIMTLSKYSFESKTRNVFNLYDRYMKVIGAAVEDVEVVLKSVLLAKNDKRKIFFRPYLAGAIAKQSGDE